MVLEWTCPSLPSPLRPICDLRVLNHFIKEAQDAEAAMKSCRDGCTLSQSVSIPQTRVDFDVWDRKNAAEKAQEVQCGLWLLQQALSVLRNSVTNAALHGHVDNLLSNVLSINAVLRSLNIPVSRDVTRYRRQNHALRGTNGKSTIPTSTIQHLESGVSHVIFLVNHAWCIALSGAK
ncbi:erythropoietin isoform X3 [Syngnathoides biaculeatus]|nr:erythropoietin isoform X3 [Syngnathoides biaculeatus]